MLFKKKISLLKSYSKTLFSLFAIVVIWHLSQSVIVGTLQNLKQLNQAKRHDFFAWVSPEVVLPVQSHPGMLRLEGYAPQAQQLSLSCQDEILEQKEIKRGYFEVAFATTSQCTHSAPRIKSDWSVIPADKPGSRDVRSLSYQLYSLQIGSEQTSLETLLRDSKGIYGIEPVFNRINQEEVLARAWDASWYGSIVKNGYRFNGDNNVHQNVAWPFLYPFIVKLYVAVSHASPEQAMLKVNEGLLLVGLLTMFVLGRLVGLPRSMALVAPSWVAFNPFAFFLHGGFSEPLFLMLQAFCLVAILRRWWWLAAILVGGMTATRFIGFLALGWLVCYWYWTDGRHLGLPQKVTRCVCFLLIGGLGVVADIIVKWASTGFPLAAFNVRAAWKVSPLSIATGTFNVNGLREGDYLPFLVICVLFFIYAIYVMVVMGTHQGLNPVLLLIFSGISLVVATSLLNPEIHSAGRYFLPFFSTLIGVLAYEPLRQRSLAVVLVLSVVGASAMSFNCLRIYQDLPPF